LFLRLLPHLLWHDSLKLIGIEVVFALATVAIFIGGVTSTS
jgi:hypothetical protein